jgi:hypothetical protein
MVASFDILGSMEVTVDGLRLDARFLDTAGSIRDQFTMVKGAASGLPHHGPGRDARIILAGRPNPFDMVWTLTATFPTTGAAQAEIYDPTGRRVRSFSLTVNASEPLTLSWDGRDDAGRSVAPGAYFARISQGDRVAALKLVRTR